MHTLRVTCALIELHGKVLLTQRSQQMSQPLLWEFPGGKIEPNESEVDCLIREIKEELGLTIVPLQRLTAVTHDYGSKRIELIPYICRLQEGEIILAEHKAYSWATQSELLKYNWCPADVPIVQEYIRLKV
ncbi:(deoxy)nucleoside triphosphate pyrophosphohydrolase [Pontibacter vulgaris]|uniref:(deoxy)nucleoside triphosphate pyrophosphohydrolase n=1 Tax=Pontibacter vulgaris TaxID=2905679 RepID=UPI001FA711E5|nr:(deoxy)nucleoside triphosphate pyrophosphohydrolase [Pontibacter vulgaris]